MLLRYIQTYIFMEKTSLVVSKLSVFVSASKKNMNRQRNFHQPPYSFNVIFIVTIFAIVIAAFSTGINSKCFQFQKDDTPAEDDVPYGNGFFHFVFATGAIHFAMLLVGWNNNHSMRNSLAGDSFVAGGGLKRTSIRLWRQST